MSIRAVIFDLDDTLFLQRQYVRSGYRCVTEMLTEDETTRRELFGWMWDDFQKSGSEDIFDAFQKHHPEICNGYDSEALRDAYLTHEPKIDLMPRMGSLLQRLQANGIPLGVIADGDPDAQLRKIDALGLREKIDQLVLTERWGKKYRKPHERAFRHVTSELGLRASELAYVGDDPRIDFRAPNALGWKTVRLRLPYQMHFTSEYKKPEDRPALVISDIRALLAYLEESCRIGDRAA